ncbi:MAG: DUF5610 domain-containing protein [Methylovulum sp.]|nr:DUF5610 domain-containing protein [Methylovulum sp.]
MEINSEYTVSYTTTSVKTSRQENGPSQTQASDTATSTSTAKIQLNQRILQDTIDVNLSAGNKSMALLFKTALEGINKALQSEFGDNAIQKVYDSGVDVSPEATADRIVSMTTAFFDKYQTSHPELSTEDALNSFVKLIGGGIDKGFSEARNILQGLNVLNGSIASNIDSTYDLVQQGLKAFVDNYQRPETIAAVDSSGQEVQEVSV